MSSARGGDLDFSIDLPVRGEWSNVERLRTSVASQVLAFSGREEAADAIALVAAELAENAIKYGRWDESATTFRVRVWGSAERAHVSVASPVEPGAGLPASLSDALAFIETFPTAEAAYRAKIDAIAQAPPASGTSGLGLVRLAYETGCRLHAEVEGAELRVTAVVPLRAADAA